MEPKTIPLQTLLDHLAGYPPDSVVTFGHGDLSFLRVKNRGPIEDPAVLNIEFGELYRITLDPSAPG